MMECGGCGMWLAMPSRALELGCLLGGLEKEKKYFDASILVKRGRCQMYRCLYFRVFHNGNILFVLNISFFVSY
jgi:hypothetical protein